MNEEEILANNIELLTQGEIEKGNLDTCMIYGISGNCGKNCPKFKDKTCEEYLTTLENEYDKQKEVLDKIKDKCLENMYIDDRGEEVENIERDIKPSEILELLEEIE